MNESRFGKKPTPSQWRLLFDVLAWGAILFWVTALLMLALGPWEPKSAAWPKLWGTALLFDILPLAAGMSWLFAKAARQLTQAGVNLSNWEENFPSRLWPVLLPLLAIVGPMIVVFILVFVRQAGK